MSTETETEAGGAAAAEGSLLETILSETNLAPGDEAYDVTKAYADRNGGSLRDAAFAVAISRVSEAIKIRSYVI